MRPHQYTKNLLVFAAPGAAGRLGDGGVALASLAAFALFCATSSAGYVINDLTDAEADRNHPTKRHRPIAAGTVTEPAARRLAGWLVFASMAGATALGPAFVFALVAYAATTMTYTLVFKTRPWVELVVLSMGFVIRAVAGGAATDTRPSAWFVVVVSAGAFAVVAGKRLAELIRVGPKTDTRAALGAYTELSLRSAVVLATAVATAGYLAWAVGAADDQAASAGGAWLLRLTTVPFVSAMARFASLAFVGRSEAPDVLVVRDPVVVSAGIVWIGLYIVGLQT